MKIGLIGAENSHVLHFINVLNVEKRYPGISITHIYGPDAPDITEKMSRDYQLDRCATEDEVIRRCDGVVVTYRKGSLHYEPVMKALRMGRAVFNDKPCAVETAQAREMVEFAERNNSLLCGGSNIKSLPGLAEIKKMIQPGATVVIAYAADMHSPYDGFWFYGVHSAELCLELCGLAYQKVHTVVNGTSVVTTVTYADKQCVLLNAPEIKNLDVSVYGYDKAEMFHVPQNYQSIGPDEFVRMMRTKTPPRPYAFYSQTVSLMDSVVSSFRTA